MLQKKMTAKRKDISDCYYRPPFELSNEFCHTVFKDYTDSNLVIIDVGAAIALDNRWEQFGDSAIQVGFEPNIVECRRLQEMYTTEGGAQGKTKKIFEPLALWSKKATLSLNITRNPDASSILKPNQAYFSRLPNPSLMDIMAVESLEAIPLDLYKSNYFDSIDVLKLDVQGTELEIALGASQVLKNEAIAVIAEIMFTPQYSGQTTFGEFDSQMKHYGFRIFDLDVRRWRHQTLPPEFDGFRIGGISYADCLYLKDPLNIETKNSVPGINDTHAYNTGSERGKLLKLIALAEFFSIPDFAIELINHGHQRETFTTEERDNFQEAIKRNKILAVNDRNSMPK
jgi:FkbM family methyltransferase